MKCKHCRAEAIPERSPDELTTKEIKELIDDIKKMGSRLIISGGDPFKREDLFEILKYAKKVKLPVGVTPTTSPLADFEKIKKLKEYNIYALGISIDGGGARSHDSFRGEKGTFKYAQNVLEYARELNIPVQVNTTLAKDTINEIKKIYSFLKRYSPPVKRWSIFFLIPTGRGVELSLPSEEDIREVFEFLYQKSKEAPFHITTTEAPSYRAFYLLKEMNKGKNLDLIIKENRRLGLGVRDGNGVVFVSHKGYVYPSGFLPIRLGNVREQKLSEIYKSSNVLRDLRDSNKLKSKCGICRFKEICGGSRARAYAIKGDYLEEDPLCFFEEEVILTIY